MTFQIDNKLHWTEHFVEYGFTVKKGVIDRVLCEQAVERIKDIFNDPRPLDQWTSDSPGVHHADYRGKSDQILRKVFDNQNLQEAVATMHGGPQYWNNRETFYVFIKPYDPQAEATLAPIGHIDFGKQHIPILYRGFAMFISLVDTEPFSGNTMVWPKTHRVIQKQLMAEPKMQQPSKFFDDLQQDLPEPFEFVAEAGDVLFMHHLALHSGSNSHSKNHKPRIALCCDGWRDQWLTEIDPATSDLSPWARSLSLNGAYKTVYDERAERAKVDPEVASEIVESM